MAHIKKCVMWRDNSKQKRESLRGDPWRPCVIPLEKGNPCFWIRGVRWREKRKGRKGKKGKGEVIFPGFDLVYGKRAEEGKRSEKLYLLSKIYGDRAVDFCRSKRQSSST